MYNSIEGRKEPPVNVSIYLGGDRWVWPRFQEMCKREGTNASRKLRDYMLHELEVHGPGNPQERLTSYTDTGDITLLGVEGRIRQKAYDRAGLVGSITTLEIKRLIRETDIPPEGVSSMGGRVTKWLRDQGVKVWG